MHAQEVIISASAHAPSPSPWPWYPNLSPPLLKVWLRACIVHVQDVIEPSFTSAHVLVSEAGFITNSVSDKTSHSLTLGAERVARARIVNNRDKLNMQSKQTADARRARIRAQDRKSRILMFGSRRDLTESKRQTLCVPAYVHRGEGVARVSQDCTENKAHAHIHRAKGVARVCIATRLHAQKYLMILRLYRRSSHSRCAHTRERPFKGWTRVGQAVRVTSRIDEKKG